MLGKRTRGQLGFVLALATLAPTGASATESDDAITSTFSNLTVAEFTTGRSGFDVLKSSQSNGNAWTCGGITDFPQLSTQHPRYQQMHDVLVALSLSRQKYMISYQVVGSMCWIKRVIIQTAG